MSAEGAGDDQSPGQRRPAAPREASGEDGEEAGEDEPEPRSEERTSSPPPRSRGVPETVASRVGLAARRSWRRAVAPGALGRHPAAVGNHAPVRGPVLPHRRHSTRPRRSGREGEAGAPAAPEGAVIAMSPSRRPGPPPPIGPTILIGPPDCSIAPARGRASRGSRKKSSGGAPDRGAGAAPAIERRPRRRREVAPFRGREAAHAAAGRCRSAEDPAGYRERGCCRRGRGWRCRPPGRPRRRCRQPGPPPRDRPTACCRRSGPRGGGRALP